MAETTKTYLGKYELLEVIGDGAEGRVYKAVCAAADVPGVARGELVAVKRLKSTGHEKESLQFRRQIEILGKLNHPNIVRHIGSFIWREKELDEDIYCLVMELLDGETLKELLKKNPHGLPWPQARSILWQTLQALHYANKNGVVHRDLKPSNIFITKDGIPKLFDFGIARQDDGELTATFVTAGAKGTPDYMAPDFALVQGGFRGDEQSDIFSFGVMMRYILAGNLPFPPLGENAIAKFYQRWLGKRPPVPGFPEPVFKVLTNTRSCISKCIDSDRGVRFKTFDEVMLDFAQIDYRKLRHGTEFYEFTDWLGKGGFGEVYRARRLSDRREVAIKRLHIAGYSDRFVREAKILRTATHPNLTEYVDFVEVRLPGDEREFYLVLEYLEGMPGAGLRDRIKNSDPGLDPGEVLQLFVRYLDCLEHLHRNGIIHRDIKPGNLYAPEHNPQRAKIFDLGIAHDEEGTRTHGQVPGTLDFMAPEFATQTSGRGSARSDIYAIGVTLYQSLTKELPFPRLPEKETDAWIAFFRRSETPLDCTFDHPVFKTHSELVPLIRRALAHNPKRRFESAAAMRDEIKNILLKWSVHTLDHDEEAPTAIMLPVAPAAPAPDREDMEVDAAETATKAADLHKIERELAELERQRLAAAEAEKKNREEAERLAQERERKAAEDAERRKREEAERHTREKERQADEEIRRKEHMAAERAEQERRRIAEAEAAEKKRIEDKRRAKIRAERAAQMRRTAAKVAKIVGIFAAVAALAVGSYFGWNKAKIQMRENTFNRVESRATAEFNSGDFSAAISDTEKALAIYPNNTAMQQIKDSAQKEIDKQKAYSDTMNKAKAFFDSRDYSNTVTWAAAAGKMPTDLAATGVATDLQKSAQRFLDDYHAAVNAANAAWQKSDFANTVAEADKALRIYPNNTAMQQIKDSAQKEIDKQKAYSDTMNKAKVFFDSRDYSNTVTWAAAAGKMPTDLAATGVATDLQKSAQRFLDDYHAAVNAANAAWQKSDFENVVAQADKALVIYPNDKEMQQLKDSSQKEIKKQKAYREEMNNATAAFDGQDFTNALAQVKAALLIFPGDPEATKMRDSVQSYLDTLNAAYTAYKNGDFATAVAKADAVINIYPTNAAMLKLKAAAQGIIENKRAYDFAMSKAYDAMNRSDYTSVASWAMTALQYMPDDGAAQKIRDRAKQLLDTFNDIVKQAQTAYQEGDFTNAITLSDKALSIHKDDATMQKLKTDVRRQLDTRLVTLLVNFNLTVPPELEYARDKKAYRLTQIRETDKPYYQAQADNLEKAYRAGNWLREGNIQTSIQDLRTAITIW